MDRRLSGCEITHFAAIRRGAPSIPSMKLTPLPSVTASLLFALLVGKNDDLEINLLETSESVNLGL
jgi:hypothetical protein